VFPKWALFGALLSLAAVNSRAATPFFPLSEVRAGMHGIGKTVFQGDRIEEFQVEILGVLPNAGPKESVILAKLSGGPLERTGVMQGMSGSPVYIDGKLLGAVAMAFPFSKDPIAAIRPIEDMVRVTQIPANPRDITRRPDVQTIADALQQGSFGVGLASAERPSDSKLINIATPLALGGFTQRAIDAFAPQLRALGLEPCQAISGGGNAAGGGSEPFGDPKRIQPGSMISVQLMQGDMNVGADGTVTYVDGDQIYAFGHRFLAMGSTGLPFSRSEVLTLLPNVNTSFKISSPKELMGVISQDRDTAVSGRFGQRASMLPLDITVHRDGKVFETYRMNMVSDALLTPMLLQMAVYSALDATERSSGAATLAVRGSIELTDRQSIRLNDVYAADTSVAQAAAMSTATPVAYVLRSGFDSLKLKSIHLDIDAIEKKHTLEIAEVVPSVHEVRPGETLSLAVQLTADDGADETRTAVYQVPFGAPAGPLFFTVADGAQTSLTELKFALTSEPRTPEQVLSLIGRLHDNDKAYVRVWRAENSYPAGVDELPAPPPSVALVMAASLGQSGIALNTMKNSRVAEITIGTSSKEGRMVTGSKTVQVEVKQ
jgi:hypothetical protein